MLIKVQHSSEGDSVFFLFQIQNNVRLFNIKMNDLVYIQQTKIKNKTPTN